MENDQDFQFLKLKQKEQTETSEYITDILRNHVELDSKTIHLIKIALAVQDGSDLFMGKRIQEAVNNGVTKGEILSAACYGLKRHNDTIVLHLKHILDASSKNNTTKKYQSICFWSDDY